ncbi:MAG: hypothetical protein RLZZ182_2033, partial [Pseudomonadota bacterium]
TVLMMGVLAAIAWPQYTQYIKKARRADVRATLMAASQHMQRLLDANNGSYQVNGAAPELPSDLTTSPPNMTGSKVMYNITVATPTANTFILTATRASAMSSDECGDYTLDQRARMNIKNTSKTLADCTR